MLSEDEFLGYLMTDTGDNPNPVQDSIGGFKTQMIIDVRQGRVISC